MTTTLRGIKTWGLTRSKESYREYKATFRTQGGVSDGPGAHLLTPGLPTFGSVWAVGNDYDPWAWCRWDAEVKQVVNDEPNTEFDVTFTFSTDPYKAWCVSNPVDDPLLIPPKISGTYAKYMEEAVADLWGRPIVNSSLELVRGKNVEFDKNRSSIKIEQNVATALQGYVLPAQMVDTVNDLPLWGFPPRCVKLSSAPWELKYYGSCYPYYARTLEFDLRYEGFDRVLLDEGTKVLHGHWNTATGQWVLDFIGGSAPNRFDPSAFDKYMDPRGNHCRVVLNGQGVPAGSISAVNGLYISIAAANTGFAIKDRTKWLPINIATPAVGATVIPPAWDSTINYVEGAPVTLAGVMYIAIDKGLNFSPALFNNKWTSVGVAPPATYDGNYSAGTTYVKGRIVQDTTSTTAGSIYVAKYSASDFTLLGIPIVF